jgi:ribosomal protein L22
MADEKDPKEDEGAAEEKRRRLAVRRKKAASKPKAASADAPAPEDPPAADEAPVAAAEPETAPEPEPEPQAAAAEEAPKAKPRRARRKAEEDKPAVAERERSAAKPRRDREYGDTPPMVRAHAKYVRTSARKARLVCDHIRGKSVPEARAILAHASRDVARDWSKLLESAVANAEHNHELIGDELRIHAVKADEGPTLKRFRPRAMGRATKIRKRTSHLSITLTPKDGVK